MLSLRKPSPEDIRQFLTAQAKLDFTYSAVGATATTPPADYVVDHTRIKLGEGEAVFTAARAALEQLAAIPPGLAGSMVSRHADQARRGRGSSCSCHRPVVAERLPDRVRRG